MSDNRQDEYLEPSKYAGHASDTDGFSKFQVEDFHYFSKIGGDGNVVFMSQGYTTEAGRNNGIESVKKNMPLEERYEAIEYDNQWYLSLKAGNRQEIAVSPLVASKEAALAYMFGGRKAAIASVKSESSEKSSMGSAASVGSALAGASAASLVGFLGTSKIGESSSTITKVNSTKTVYYTDDKYLSPDAYTSNIANKSVIDDSFVQFAEGDRFYWGLLDSDGKLAMRSQGYASAGDRDSAIKNIGSGKNNGSNYSILETREGKYYVLLRGSDNKEIGRSAVFSTRAAAVAFVPETTVTYQTIASSAGGAGFAGMSAKATAAMAAAASSNVALASAPAAAKFIPTALASAPAIAAVTTKLAPAAFPIGKLLWGLLPVLLIPLLLLLVKPVPALVPLKATIAAVPPAPPPPVVPPPIPAPIKIAKVGPKQGPKSGNF